MGSKKTRYAFAYETNKIIVKAKNSYYHIILVESGELEINMNDKKMLIAKPCCLCIDNNTAIEVGSYNNVKCKVIDFHPDIIYEDYNSMIKSESIAKLHTKNQIQIIFSNNIIANIEYYTLNKLINYFDMCIRCSSGSGALTNLFTLRKYLILLLFEIENLNDNEMPSLIHDEVVFNEITEYIKSNLKEHITLETLSNRFFTNKNKIEYLFNTYANVSFGLYYKNCRLKSAVYLLTQTDKDLDMIAFMLGFSNSQNFIRFFKNNKGISPNKYRKFMECGKYEE